MANSSNSSPNASKLSYANAPMLSWAKDSGIVILVIVVTLLIIMILVYIIRLFKTTGLKRIDLLNKVVPLDQRNNLPYIVPAGKMAVTTRGQEFTYSFWIYLSEFYENSTSHKVLFMRGNNSNVTTQVDTNANPLVMMDKSTNAMYFALSTTASGQASLVDINDITTSAGKSSYMVAKVDYVPLQRWIHFTMVVRDNILTIFMDGDIYSITTTNDVKTPTGVRPLVRGTSGDGIIGDPNNPIKGFIGKFEFYNYALSHKQIQSMYKSGPINKSFLAYMGMGNFGVRSPVYSIDG